MWFFIVSSRCFDIVFRLISYLVWKRKQNINICNTGVSFSFYKYNFGDFDKLNQLKKNCWYFLFELLWTTSVWNDLNMNHLFIVKFLMESTMNAFNYDPKPLSLSPALFYSSSSSISSLHTVSIFPLYINIAKLVSNMFKY